jgi:hypothetical protein
MLCAVFVRLEYDRYVLLDAFVPNLEILGYCVSEPNNATSAVFVEDLFPAMVSPFQPQKLCVWFGWLQMNHHHHHRIRSNNFKIIPRMDEGISKLAVDRPPSTSERT